MIDRFEIRDQAVHKTERLTKSWNSNVRESLLRASFNPCRLVLEIGLHVADTSPDVLDDCGHHVRLGRVAVSATLPLLV